MNIAVLGLGHVGAATVACLSRSGHHVLGVDIDPAKVAALAEGRSPVVEPSVTELLSAGARADRVLGAMSLDGHVDRLDIAIVCVGTPAGTDGRLDLSHLQRVAGQLGQAVRERSTGRPLLLVFRSTAPPGTMDRLVLPTLAQCAGEPPGRSYEAAYNPEFLREASAVRDYFAPPKIVIGEREKGITRGLAGLYEGIEAPLFEVPFAVAEMAKLVDNSFHALKVAFANEVGRVCVEHALPPQDVAGILAADTKLNLSPAYLRPGEPYGGACLPKDLSAMLALGGDVGEAMPVLSGVGPSNDRHLAWLIRAIHARQPPPGPILLIGLSFKAGTDDLRNSHLLALAERLLENGYRLDIIDPDVEPACLIGAVPGVRRRHRAELAARMTKDIEGAAARARLIVIGKIIPGLSKRLPPAATTIDITRLSGL